MKSETWLSLSLITLVITIIGMITVQLFNGEIILMASVSMTGMTFVIVFSFIAMMNTDE